MSEKPRRVLSGLEFPFNVIPIHKAQLLSCGPIMIYTYNFIMQLSLFNIFTLFIFFNVFYINGFSPLFFYILQMIVVVAVALLSQVLDHVSKKGGL